MDEEPQRAAPVRQGQVAIENRGAQDSLAVPSGLIHDWIGAAFIPGVTLEKTLALVQEGGELAYLLLHDPEYRRVRKEHLVEAGKRIRLKQNIRLLSQLLADLDGRRSAFYVVSAAPRK